MSIDGIAMQSAPRRHMQKSNEAKSLVRDHYEGNNLNFVGRSEAPNDEIEKLYANAFREAVDSAPKGEIKITQARTPYDLYLCATNRKTGKAVILHAKTLGVGFYNARVQARENGQAEYLNWLTANDPNKVRAQYKELREYMVKHIK
jgi:hypothetical protein